MSTDFVRFGQKKKKKRKQKKKMMMLHFQWKERMDIDITKVSTCRKYCRLKLLTLAARLDLNTRLSRETKTSQNGGAFKICIALMRVL